MQLLVTRMKTWRHVYYKCSRTLNLLGPGSTPHERLTVWPYEVHYLPDLRLKPHVQHAVSLVQHQVSAPPEVGLARLQEVYQSTRSGNHHLTSCEEKMSERQGSDRKTGPETVEGSGQKEWSEIVSQKEYATRGRWERQMV